MKRIFTILMALAVLMCAACAETGQLTAKGSATVYLDADIVTVVMGLRLEGEDLSKLQSEANATLSAIVDALLEAGLDKDCLSTGILQIMPNYEFVSDSLLSRGGKNELSGYSIDSTLNIRTGDMDKIGAYIDAAFKAGANSLESIEFSAQDVIDARMQALELAVQAAGQKAEVMAGAAGVALEGVLEISEESVSSYSYSNSAANYTAPALAAGEVMLSAEGTEIYAAQIAVTANVKICYQIK